MCEKCKALIEEAKSRAIEVRLSDLGYELEPEKIHAIFPQLRIIKLDSGSECVFYNNGTQEGVFVIGFKEIEMVHTVDGKAALIVDCFIDRPVMMKIVNPDLN